LQALRDHALILGDLESNLFTGKHLMNGLGILARVLLLGTCCLSFDLRAQAADLTGAWATRSSACDKVFVKKGSKISLTKNADLHGSGFIIEGGQIRGRIANCKIKSTKEDGSTIHFIAACATDIMLSDVQLSLRIIDQATVARIFPGVSGVEVIYARCAL
jgi:hypothetical protein